MTVADGSRDVGRWGGARLLPRALIVGLIGLGLWTVGVVIEPRQALASYLFAYVATLTVVLGALMQVMMSHVTAARWFVVLRRLTLVVVAALPALALLALPVLFGARLLYPWASPATLSPEASVLAARRHAWLNLPFFTLRALIYLAVWTCCGELLRRWSLRQDDDGEDAVIAATRRQRRVSAVGLIAVGLALTFAAFDWLMSLDPRWYSTIYGVYVFAGGFLAALGLVAVLANWSRQSGGALAGAVTPEHFGALGKLLLTFVIFWGYIAFSQFLIIWIGDIPDDASWYLVRAKGSWGALALVVAFGQFALPFVLLLSRPLKRRPTAMALIGAWLLVMHLCDVYWLVLPALHPGGMRLSWLDGAALLMVGGLATAAAVSRARGQVALPIGDPYLEPSVRYAEP